MTDKAPSSAVALGCTSINLLLLSKSLLDRYLHLLLTPSRCSGANDLQGKCSRIPINILMPMRVRAPKSRTHATLTLVVARARVGTWLKRSGTWSCACMFQENSDLHVVRHCQSRRDSEIEGFRLQPKCVELCAIVLRFAPCYIISCCTISFCLFFVLCPLRSRSFQSFLFWTASHHGKCSAFHPRNRQWQERTRHCLCRLGATMAKYWCAARGRSLRDVTSQQITTCSKLEAP